MQFSHLRHATPGRAPFRGLHASSPSPSTSIFALVCRSSVARGAFVFVAAAVWQLQTSYGPRFWSCIPTMRLGLCKSPTTRQGLCIRHRFLSFVLTLHSAFLTLCVLSDAERVLLTCWQGHEGSRLCLRLLCYATETQTFTTSSPATTPITSNLLLHHLFPVILT